jgi:hypothetical protein
LPAYKREPEIRSLEDIVFLMKRLMLCQTGYTPDRVRLRTDHLLVKKIYCHT